MKTLIYNIGYFFLEAKRTIQFNFISNLISIIGTALILFLLGMVIAGWSIGDQLIASLNEEAEISAYFTESIDMEAAVVLADTVKNIPGVRKVSYIGEEEARTQMEDTLGEEAEVLSLFEENPFEDYLEVRINLADMDTVITDLRNLEGVEYVRDNRVVLEQMKDITQGLRIFGSLVMIAVGITTLIIISHMIRQGIYNNKDQINTLRLLGAPNSFIGFPFVLAGMLLTLLGGILATVGLVLLMKEGYAGLSGVIPFIPLPSQKTLVNQVIIYVLSTSILLGLFGSLFGLSSIRKEESKE